MKPTALIIGNLTLQPIEYHESADPRGELTIRARVRIAGDERQQLRTMMLSREPVTVVRQGISETPRSMEVEPIISSEHDDATMYDLELSDPFPKSERRPPLIYAVDQGRTQRNAAEAMELVEGLIELLASKGVLTRDEAETIRRNAVSRRWERIYASRAVDNIEDVPFHESKAPDDERP